MQRYVGRSQVSPLQPEWWYDVDILPVFRGYRIPDLSVPSASAGQWIESYLRSTNSFMLKRDTISKVVKLVGPIGLLLHTKRLSQSQEVEARDVKLYFPLNQTIPHGGLMIITQLALRPDT